MRAREFLLGTPNILAEGLMKTGGGDNDWFKEKYWMSFLEGIAGGQVYSFKINGENINGVIELDNTLIDDIRYAIEAEDSAKLKRIAFPVNEVDDDDEPTGETYKGVKLRQIFKDEKIKGELKPNLGNIAELVLGCAVTAKFEAQGQLISEENVISIAGRLAAGKGSMTASSGKDTITFSASVPFIDRKVFFAYATDRLGEFPVTQDTIDGINQHLKSSISYVNNSNKVKIALDKAAQDQGANQVDVKSDGGNAEQQKTTKVDLKISIDGTQFNLLSIKAGRVGQFGQVSGYKFDALNNFFDQSIGIQISEKVERKFEEPDPTIGGTEKTTNKADVRFSNFNNGFTAAYKEIAGLLTKLSNSNQAELIERVYHGILHHATRNEENVEMIILNPSAKKAFSELTFGKELRDALDDYKLVVHEGTSASMHIIEIYGFPVTDKAKKAMGTGKELLVKYRSYMQKNAVRNIIEMGGLLKELADWEKIEEKQANKPQQVTNPVKTFNAPVVKSPAVKKHSAPVPASIQNQTKQIGAKIPMGSEPPTETL
jgi:hypothetical protein